MTKTIVVEIAGESYTGVVTDLDGFLAAGLLMPDIEQIIKNEEGLTRAFQSFAVEQQTMNALGESAQNAIAESWGDRVVLRLTNNREIRLSFAQRIREIFPDIPMSFVSYKLWKDPTGNTHEEGSIRLDLKDVMDILLEIMSQGFESAPEKPVAKLDEVADLENRLAIARSLKPKGFDPMSMG